MRFRLRLPDLSKVENRDKVTFLIGAVSALSQLVTPGPYTGPILIFSAGCLGVPRLMHLQDQKREAESTAGPTNGKPAGGKGPAKPPQE